jgi:sestrin
MIFINFFSFCTEKSVDTTPFRIAVWNYTHRLLGIFHDDYDYELVNVWLLQPLKQYIKKIV